MARKAPPESTMKDARQMFCRAMVLRAQMFFHRHRVVGAALDGGVVGDDDAFASEIRPTPVITLAECTSRRHRGVGRER